MASLLSVEIALQLAQFANFLLINLSGSNVIFTENGPLDFLIWLMMTSFISPWVHSFRSSTSDVTSHISCR